MDTLFGPDSKFMEILSRVYDYIKLALLFIVFSIPVITMSASATAVMTVGMRIERDEAPTIWKPFLKAFKDNFKQSTLFMLIILMVITIMAFDWYYLMEMDSSMLIRIARAVVCFLVLFFTTISLYAFPLMARYELTMKEVIHNAVIFSIMNFAKNILACGIIVIGVLLYTYLPASMPVVLVAFPGVVICYMSKLCVSSFRIMEEEMDI